MGDGITGYEAPTLEVVAPITEVTLQVDGGSLFDSAPSEN